MGIHFRNFSCSCGNHFKSSKLPMPPCPKCGWKVLFPDIQKRKHVPPPRETYKDVPDLIGECDCGFWRKSTDKPEICEECKKELKFHILNTKEKRQKFSNKYKWLKESEWCEKCGKEFDSDKFGDLCRGCQELGEELGEELCDDHDDYYLRSPDPNDGIRFRE